jgi:hypothetical protein
MKLIPSRRVVQHQVDEPPGGGAGAEHVVAVATGLDCMISIPQNVR